RAILLICPACSTQIDYCYFTIEEFEKSFPDLLILSDKQTEWLRNNYSFLLEQEILLCSSCGRVHPVCQLFQIAEYERTLDEVKYNWETIRRDISSLLEEKENLERRRRKLSEIRLLKEIKDIEDSRIFELLERVSLEEKLDLNKLEELLDEELVISKRYSEIKTQLAYILGSWFRRFLYLIKKALGLDEREKELVVLGQKLEDVQNKKKNWFTQLKDIIDKKLGILGEDLRMLPRTKYKNLESLNKELQTRIESLTTPKQRKLIEILRRQGIITREYNLREEVLINLMDKSKCFYCGGKVENMPALSFFFITCPDAVLVSDDLLAFSVEKERFCNDFYLYEPLIK
ncbi:MAG: hypothetical protein QW279_12910, partial [Candidatus Jordarchaeaceae archaeon]